MTKGGTTLGHMFLMRGVVNIPLVFSAYLSILFVRFYFVSVMCSLDLLLQMANLELLQLNM